MIKTLTVFFLAIFVALGLNGQNSGLSMYLTGNDNAQGDIIMKTARATLTYKASFFMTNGFQLTGGHNGGYSGFQDSPDKGFCYIFSIWDPTSGDIKASYVGPGTVVERFGGEGTGLKSMNLTLGWNLNNWYTFVSRSWDVENRTHFGFWVRDISGNKWSHLVTFDHPGTSVRFNGQTNSFVEDWLSYGAHRRRMEMKDGFKRRTNGSWMPVTSYRYTIVSGDAAVGGRSYNYGSAYDAGTESGYVFMQSGGSTTKSFTGTPPISFSNNPGSEPANPAIVFTLTCASPQAVNWEVPVSSTPQFKYTIKINGVDVASEMASDVRCHPINAVVGSTVELTLEDILGRTTTHSTVVSNDNGCKPCTQPIVVEGVKVVGFSSQEIVGENGAAANAVDGNPSSIWHTKWLGGDDQYPHHIVLDLGKEYAVTGFSYLPRQNSANGRIARYEIYVANDQLNWGDAVKTGTWANNAAEKLESFDVKTGRYVKLVGLSEVGGGPWASAAELKVMAEVDINIINSVDPIAADVPVVNTYNGQLLVSSASAMHLRAYDLLGRLVLQTDVKPGKHQFPVAVRDFLIVQLHNEHGQVVSKKLMVD